MHFNLWAHKQTTGTTDTARCISGANGIRAAQDGKGGLFSFSFSFHIYIFFFISFSSYLFRFVFCFFFCLRLGRYHEGRILLGRQVDGTDRRDI